MICRLKNYNTFNNKKINSFFYIVLFVGLFLIIKSCKKDPVENTISNEPIFKNLENNNIDPDTQIQVRMLNINTNSALLISQVEMHQGATILQHGHIYSKNTRGAALLLPRGLLSNRIFKTVLGEKSDSESYTSSIIDLEPETTYYVRAYVEISSGVYYSLENNFTTLEEETALSGSALSGSALSGSRLSDSGLSDSGLPNPATSYTTIPDNNFRNAILRCINTNGISTLSGQISNYFNCTENYEGMITASGNQIRTDALERISAFRYGIADKSFNNVYVIKDITGITAMTALDTLAVPFNSLTSIDLSNNTALTFLNIELNSLTQLDLFSNTALISLNATTNRLSSLDISNNRRLNNLIVNDNKLTDLDIYHNTELINLGVYANRLTYLDVSFNTNINTLSIYRNPALNCIEINASQLSGGTNRITSIVKDDAHNLYIDCGYHTIIPDDNFRNAILNCINTNENTTLLGKKTWWVSCNENYDGTISARGNKIKREALQSITRFAYCLVCEDVRISDNNLKITSTVGVEQMIALDSLYLYNNNISSLDISNNTELIRLGLGYNQIDTIDISNNTALTLLQLSYNNLDTIDVSNNIALEWLYVSNNPLLRNLDISANTSLTKVNTVSTPLLECIQVDHSQLSGESNYLMPYNIFTNEGFLKSVTQTISTTCP